jgi:hypothetical protein
VLHVVRVVLLPRHKNSDFTITIQTVLPIIFFEKYIPHKATLSGALCGRSVDRSVGL